MLPKSILPACDRFINSASLVVLAPASIRVKLANKKAQLLMSPLLIQLLIIGLVAGVAGGMFGIGGGAIMVPAMVLLMGMDQKFATGTSVAAQILPIGILAAIVYYRNGNLNIKHAVIIAVGLIVGNFFGALFANQPYISSETMKKLYGIFLFVIGARYLFF
jgi:uncharacterized membrane protein YfcA